MEFDFDPAKSVADAEKHGIDFMDAQRLWDDPELLIAPARTEGEARFLAIGRIGTTHWSAVFVRRGAILRLISVRRARDREIEIYEGR